MYLWPIFARTALDPVAKKALEFKEEQQSTVRFVLSVSFSLFESSPWEELAGAPSYSLFPCLFSLK